MTGIRIGIDLGGTKIAIAAFDPAMREVYARRILAPRDDYRATIAAMGDLVRGAEQQLGVTATVGVAMPGSISPLTGVVQNSNSTWLNGMPLQTDLAAHLRRDVRTSNDANCFALSEALDGAAKDARSVFGVIIGTGCGGGLVYGGKIVDGPRGCGGEWGHVSLPWPEADEVPGPACWCGRSGCMETWVSGTGLYQDYLRRGGDAARAKDAVAVEMLAGEGDAVAAAAFQRHTFRLARGLAMIVNIVDPEVIVLGGGLSKLSHLYDELPALMRSYIFSHDRAVAVRPPVYGDASGVRGAAWLWDA